MKLALRLGRTLHELEESMESREWPMWQAFAELDPFDDDRRDALPARLLLTLRAMFVKDGAMKVGPEDLMPYLGVRRATAEEVESGGLRVTARMWRFLRGKR